MIFFEKASTRTAKGCPHGNGSFAVQDNTAHDIITVHGRGVRLCHGRCLCRALASPFAVRLFFVVRSGSALPCVGRCLCSMASLPCAISLPCMISLSHDKEIFAMRQRMAELSSTAASVFPVV
jgi:hypothetical protein